MTFDAVPEELLIEHIADLMLALHNVSTGELNLQLPDEVLDGPLAEIARDVRELAANLAAEESRLAAYQQELLAKLDMVEKQRQTIRELSTPILEVWEGVLALPILGIVDTARASEITGELLTSVTRSKAVLVIIDFTGIETMDTRTCHHFLQLTRSCELLGARGVLTGIAPTVAHSIVQLGVEMGGVHTYRSMKEALAGHLASRRSRRNGAGR